MKKLWVLPLAAVLCGKPVDPPALKAPLPSFQKKSCQEAARREFLLAFAYQRESRSESRRRLHRADALLRRCEEPALRSRIEGLRNSAP